MHQHNIICIAAKWYGQKKVMLFHGPSAVEEFDIEARKADVCLGKNNMSFDVKYINTERMMRGLQPYPEWVDTSEDLEQQLRRNFNFTSQSLDFVSELMGMGGKIKMDYSDWVDISNYELLLDLDVCRTPLTNYQSMVLFYDSKRNVTKKGRTALKKMYFYNKKDVLDTEAIFRRVLPYIRPKFNTSALKVDHGCTLCGSDDLVATRIIIKGKTKYQLFDCLAHKGYAGKCTWHYKKGSHSKTFAKMGQ
jgi:hypothetical protein